MELADTKYAALHRNTPHYGSDDYTNHHSISTDVDLLLEGTDTTLAKDCGPKLVEYAEASICEYRINNIVNHQIEVYRHPSIEGIYGDEVIYKPDESIEALNAPGKSVAVSDLLPPIK